MISRLIVSIKVNSEWEWHVVTIIGIFQTELIAVKNRSHNLF